MFVCDADGAVRRRDEQSDELAAAVQEAADARPASDVELNKLLARMTPAERAAAEVSATQSGGKKSRRALNDAYARAVDVTQLHEFKLFQAMDVERVNEARAAWRAKGRTGEPPPLLLPADELPDWAVAAVAQVAGRAAGAVAAADTSARGRRRSSRRLPKRTSRSRWPRRAAR